MWAAVSQEKKGKNLPHLPRSSFQVHQLAKLCGNEGEASWECDNSRTLSTKREGGQD